MHTSRIHVIAGLVMAAGAAVLAQPDRNPGTQPGTTQPGTRQPPGLERQPPGQQRTPPGQERTRPGLPPDQVSNQAVEQMIASWPRESQDAAKATIQKYGPPNAMTSGMLVWKQNGPWKKTVVSAEPWEHEFPMPHQDVLMNVVGYKVPLDMYDELARFDGSIIAFRTPGEIAARCDREESNFLALNLAHEVVTGKRTVEEARDFLAKEIQNLQQGKSSTYTQGLMFEPDDAAADPDKPASGGMTPSPTDPLQPRRQEPGRPSTTPPRNPQPSEPPSPTPPSPR